MTRYFRLSILLAAAACAGEQGEAGPRGPQGADGAPCTITTDGGIATITCADGGSSTLEAGDCSVADNGDGSHTISCPDGSNTVVREGEKLPRASISGTAGRFGFEPEAGISVTVVEVDRTVTTDADGRFEIDDLPPGLYTLVIQREGYTAIRHENVALLGRDLELGEQLLKIGRLAFAGLPAEPLLAPGEQHSALFVPYDGDHGPGDLALIDMGSLEIDKLAEGVEGPVEFLDDRFLAVRDAKAWEGDYLIFDLEQGGSLRLAAVDAIEPMSEGVLVARDGGWEHVTLPGGASTPVPGAFTSASNDRRFALLEQGSGSIAIFDAASGITTDFVQRQGNRTFSFGGGSAALIVENEEGAYDVLVIDSATMSVKVAGTSDTPYRSISFSGDGSTLAWPRADGCAYFDLERDAGGLIPNPGARHVFTIPDGSFAACSSNTGWVLAELHTDRTHPLSMPPQFDRTATFAVTTDGEIITLLELATFASRELELAHDYVELIGDHLVVRHGDELIVVDAATLQQEAYPEASAWNVSDDGHYLVAMEQDALRSVLYTLDEGPSSAVEFEGMSLTFDADSSHLLVASEQSVFGLGELSILDVASGEQTPIDEDVLGLKLGRTGFWYVTGDYRSLLLGSDTREAFAGIGYYWVAWK